MSFAQIETNLFGVIIVTKAVIPYFRERGAGHIIQVTSVAGRIGPTGRAPYAAAKFGVEGSSESLSREVGPLGVKVTIVELGGFRTDFAGSSTELREGRAEYDSTVGETVRFQRSYNGRQPGDPAKAAAALLQLVSLAEPPLRLPLGSDCYGAVEKSALATLEAGKRGRISACRLTSGEIDLEVRLCGRGLLRWISLVAMIERQGEAIVLRVWPFQEADLLVSLFTREQGRVKGVARHAMRSRRRFGGALEPMTYVKATYAERPKQELVRLDAFEILSSPLSKPIDYARTAALQFVAEVIEEALPEQAPEDAVFRLVLAVLDQIQVGRVFMPVTYFALWMSRLMGWMPELGRCVVCGVMLDPSNGGGATVWYSATSDGVTCGDDRRPGSVALSAASVAEAIRIFRGTVGELAKEEWPKTRAADLRRFAVETLERHLERRLVSARALGGRA